MLGEQFSFIGGATNDVRGAQNHTIYGASIPGGVGNVIGNTNFWTGGSGSGGNYSFIAGGLSNQVSSDYSFAGGKYAQATNANSFIWSDGSATNTTTTNNAFFIYATNGLWVNGVQINNGGSSSNAIANLYGFGTNATLLGTNNISGIIFTNVINPLLSEISVTNLVFSDTNYFFNGGLALGVCGNFPHQCH